MDLQESDSDEEIMEDSSYNPTVTGAYEDGRAPEFSGTRLHLTINGEEEPGYDPVTGEMVIYCPWANFTIFYGDFRYSDELVPLGKVESGLEVLSSKTEDFTGVLELIEAE